jgi:hypothetical protein
VKIRSGAVITTIRAMSRRNTTGLGPQQSGLPVIPKWRGACAGSSAYFMAV